jgi:predicted transcriptional regulator
MEFTKREEELMNFFWNQARPLTSNDILKDCVDRTWKNKYLPVMLKSLENKKAIKVCGVVQYGTQYARQFIPIISKEEYFTQLAVNGGVNLLSFSKVVFNLATENKKEEEQKEIMNQLEEIIKDMESKKE